MKLSSLFIFSSSVGSFRIFDIGLTSVHLSKSIRHISSSRSHDFQLKMSLQHTNISEETLTRSIQYALTHGIVYGIKESPPSPIHFKSIHAPFTLRPYKYPQTAFDKAIVLAPLFNILVDKISRDAQWLIDSLTATAASDEFTRNLLHILKEVNDKNYQSSLLYRQQDISLGMGLPYIIIVYAY